MQRRLNVCAHQSQHQHNLGFRPFFDQRLNHVHIKSQYYRRTVQSMSLMHIFTVLHPNSGHSHHLQTLLKSGNQVSQEVSDRSNYLQSKSRICFKCNFFPSFYPSILIMSAFSNNIIIFSTFLILPSRRICATHPRNFFSGLSPA